MKANARSIIDLVPLLRDHISDNEFYVGPVNILKPEDAISHEEAMEKRRQYTDEDARKLGYPNVHVLHLEDLLGKIAGEWRRTKDLKTLE